MDEDEWKYYQKQSFVTPRIRSLKTDKYRYYVCRVFGAFKQKMPIQRW